MDKNYVHVGNIIEQERVRRQAQISKSIINEVYDHIEKAHNDDLNYNIEKSDNLTRFETDIQDLNKAETELLLHKIQRQLNADSESTLLKAMKSIAINHYNDIEKAAHGIYEDNAENRRLNRVGQEYGHAAQQKEPTNKQPKKQEEAGGGLQAHAAKASDEALKRAAADEKADKSVREAAKAELAKRNGDSNSESMLDEEGRLNKNHPDAKRFTELDKKWDNKETRGQMTSDEMSELLELQKKFFNAQHEFFDKQNDNSERKIGSNSSDNSESNNSESEGVNDEVDNSSSGSEENNNDDKQEKPLTTTEKYEATSLARKMVGNEYRKAMKMSDIFEKMEDFSDAQVSHFAISAVMHGLNADGADERNEYLRGAKEAMRYLKHSRKNDSSMSDYLNTAFDGQSVGGSLDDDKKKELDKFVDLSNHMKKSGLEKQLDDATPEELKYIMVRAIEDKISSSKSGNMEGINHIIQEGIHKIKENNDLGDDYVISWNMLLD